MHFYAAEGVIYQIYDKIDQNQIETQRRLESIQKKQDKMVKKQDKMVMKQDKMGNDIQIVKEEQKRLGAEQGKTNILLNKILGFLESNPSFAKNEKKEIPENVELGEAHSIIPKEESSGRKKIKRH